MEFCLRQPTWELEEANEATWALLQGTQDSYSLPWNRSQSVWANGSIEGLSTSSWDLVKLKCIGEVWVKWEREK